MEAFINNINKKGKKNLKGKKKIFKKSKNITNHLNIFKKVCKQQYWDTMLRNNAYKKLFMEKRKKIENSQKMLNDVANKQF